MFLSESDINILREVLDEYTRQASESITVPPELENYTFSKRFEWRMYRLIQRQKKSYYALIDTVSKRVAAYILIVLICIFVTVFSVKAWREPFINFVVETYEKFTSIFVDKDTVARTNVDVEFEIKLPQYIPEGYEIKSISRNDNIVSYTYKNEFNKKLTYINSSIEFYKMTADTEKTGCEVIFIDDKQGIYYKNKKMSNLIFEDETRIINISGYLSKEELIKIAISLK